MSILSQSSLNKIGVVTIRKTNTPKIILGLGKKLAEIDYDTLFENKPKK